MPAKQRKENKSQKKRYILFAPSGLLHPDAGPNSTRPPSPTSIRSPVLARGLEPRRSSWLPSRCFCFANPARWGQPAGAPQCDVGGAWCGWSVISALLAAVPLLRSITDRLYCPLVVVWVGRVVIDRKSDLSCSALSDAEPHFPLVLHLSCEGLAAG